MEMVFKRGSAYLVDLLITSLLLMVILSIIPVNKNEKIVANKMNTTYENYLSEKITFEQFFTDYANYSKKYDEIRLPQTIISLTLIVIVFILAPILLNGSTIGMKLFRLKMVGSNEKIGIWSLILRNTIVNGMLFLVVIICLLFITNSKQYFLISSILGILQILVAIFSGFMVLYRKDNRAWHDLLSKSYVTKIN